MYNRMGDEQIAAALRYENGVKPAIRKFVFDKIRKTKDLPDAGVYKVTPAQVERAHKGLLFTGAVEAVDGTFCHPRDFATDRQPDWHLQHIVQGRPGTYMHRLYRRDLRAGGVDDIDTMLNSAPEAHGPGRCRLE